MKHIIFTIYFFYITLFCVAQNNQYSPISVKIVDETNNPLTNSSVRLINAKGNIISNGNGIFTIFLTSNSDTLWVSYIGYRDEKVYITRADTSPIVITLKTAEATQLQEVVVNTGYQSLSKERATGSFEKIGEALIKRSVSTDILSRLEGVSSLNFNNRASGKSLSIRGSSTIMGNAAPLIVLDNFPYDGDINNINPNDIENITFLKDAAAASIWGVRAANGVIVITSKKGKYNRPATLDFSANLTYGSRPDLYYAPILGSSDFIELEQFLFDKGYYNATLNNARRPVVSPVIELLAQQRNGTLSYQVVNEQTENLKKNDVRRDLDKYFYQPSFNQQYALSYSGGSSKYNYILSAGWDKNNENLKRNGLERLTLRSENNLNPFKGLYLQAGIIFTQINRQNNNSGIQTVSSSPKGFYPYASLTDENGNSLAIPYEYRLAYIDTVGSGKLLDWKYRPLDELNMANNTSKQTDIRLNTGMQYKLDNGLGVEIRYQYEQQSGNSRNVYDPNSFTARNWVNLFSYRNGSTMGYRVPIGGILDLANSSMQSHVGRGQINYDKSWKSIHRISAIAGMEVRETHTTSNRNRTYGYNDDILTFGGINYTDLLPTYNNLRGTLRIPNPTDFGDNLLRFTSYYGNAGYTLMDRYTLSASLRKDASNLFGVSANQKGVPLWSSGVSWQINKEPFYKLDILPLLKLRMTYGYNGNVDNTLSALTTIRYGTNAYLTGLDYAYVFSPGNPELRWEKSAMLNIGLDFGFTNNRLSGSIDYYSRRGTDLIGQAPIDPTTGVLSPASEFLYKGNVANMKGNGLDIILHGNIIQGKFNWQSDAILNYTKNKVTNYQISSSATAANYVGYGLLVSPFVGNPVYGIYSYDWAGLDPENGDPQGYLNGEISKDYYSIISSAPSTLVYHGSAVPTVFGSIRNTLSYWNFSLSFNFMYKGGYYFRRSSIDYLALYANWRGGHADYLQRWQKPGDEQRTNVPSMPYPANSGRDAFYNNSTVLVGKGDHIRLQDINLCYTLSRNKKGKHIKQLQIYSYMNNLGILWRANKVGLDPDYYAGGFPLPLTVSLGCKASF
ncbi:SusC/RagA family TonB-linked outer membrane protein [Flavobacterium ginsenosidimutans]|uniref:SusC/RagA family TonB-linked outer membrane protein n=1 Tax=Flavobacterium ginsenosidimutans TaxID=687844 RepID=A0ABZ2Q637_9FLAO